MSSVVPTSGETLQANILSMDQLATMKTCFSRLTDWAQCCAVFSSPELPQAFTMLTRDVTYLRLATSLENAIAGQFVPGHNQTPESVSSIGLAPWIIFYLTSERETNPVEYVLPPTYPHALWVQQTSLEAFTRLIAFFTSHLLPPPTDTAVGLPPLSETGLRVCLRRHDHNTCVYADIFSRDVQNKFPAPAEQYPLIVTVDGQMQNVPLLWPFADARHDPLASVGGRAFTMITPEERAIEDELNSQYRRMLATLKRDPNGDLSALLPNDMVPRLEFSATTAFKETASLLRRCIDNPDHLPLPSPVHCCEFASKAFRVQHQALRSSHRAARATMPAACTDASSAWAYVLDRLPIYTVHCRAPARAGSPPEHPFHLPVLSLPVPRFVYDSFAAGAAGSPYVTRPRGAKPVTDIHAPQDAVRFEPRYHGPVFMTGDRLIRVVTSLSSTASTGDPLPKDLLTEVPAVLPSPATSMEFDVRRPAASVLGWRRAQCPAGLDLAMDEALRATRLGPAYHHRRALFAAALRRAGTAGTAAGATPGSTPVALASQYVTDRAHALGLASDAEIAAAGRRYVRGDAALAVSAEAEPSVPVPLPAHEVFCTLVIHPHIPPDEKAAAFEQMMWRQSGCLALARVALWRARAAVGRAISAAGGVDNLAKETNTQLTRAQRELLCGNGSSTVALTPPTSSRPAVALQAMLDKARAICDTNSVANASAAQIITELRLYAGLLSVPVAHRVPNQSLFSGFDTTYNLRESRHASLAHPGADVSAGIAFALAAERFDAITRYYRLAGRDSTFASQSPQIEAIAQELGSAWPVVQAAVTACRSTVVRSIPSALRRDAGLFLAPADREESSWMRLRQCDSNSATVLRDAATLLTATAANRAEDILRSIPSELLVLSPRALADGITGCLTGHESRPIYISLNSDRDVARDIACPAPAAVSFGEILDTYLSNNIIDQSFGESLATDCYPYRFIGPLRFVGAGSFASCFLFVDTCTGAPTASKQSTRQWTPRPDDAAAPGQAQLTGTAPFAPTPATAALPRLRETDIAVGTVVSPRQPAPNGTGQGSDAGPSADVRLFDYTLREAVNLARCSGRPCCTVVIGEYFSIYTCSHTLMLHYTPTQRLSALVGRMGASELQAYLRDLLIGLAASRDPDYRPPADIFPGAARAHACLHRSDSSAAGRQLLPAGDAVLQGFGASELAGLASSDDVSVLIRYSRDRLIHRDIKPANFLWHPPHRLADGTVCYESGVLIDFGLAVVENGAEIVKNKMGGASDRRTRVLSQVADGAYHQRVNTPVATKDVGTGLKALASGLTPCPDRDNGHNHRFRGVLKFTPLIQPTHPVRSARFVSARAGTRGYRAPEMLMGLPHSPASDIWSVGSVFLGLLLAQTDLFAPPRPEYVTLATPTTGTATRAPEFPSTVTYARPSSGVAIRAVEQRTGQVLYELMAIRSLIGAEAFAQVCDHAGVDMVHSYAGCPPALDERVLAELVRARQPAVHSELVNSMNGTGLYRVLLRMLSWHPEQRGTAAELLEDPWFKTSFTDKSK